MADIFNRGTLEDNSASFVLNLKRQFQRNLLLHRYVSRKRTRKKGVIVPYLFSANPLISPRGTCFFRVSDLWVKGLDIKNTTACESGGSGAEVECALKEILRNLLLSLLVSSPSLRALRLQCQ